MCEELIENEIRGRIDDSLEDLRDEDCRLGICVWELIENEKMINEI